jgi:type IX secretion system PorP/SprF family membrane protein
MRTITKHILPLVLVLAANFAVGQQEYMLTHYMFNKMAINPGYTGTQEAISITGIHRSQWVSFKGAPTTQSITAHMPITGKNFGVGMEIVNDQIGPTQNIGITGSFAYQLKLNKKSKLSLGLSAGLNFFSSNLTSLTTINQNDAAFAENISNEMVPNVGFGAYYYTKKYFAGISTPKLLQNNLNVDNPTGTGLAVSHEQRHYFLMGGAIFNLTSDGKFKIKPTTLVKVTGGAPIQIDLTGNVIYNDQITAGISLRTGDAMGLLLGYNINSDFTVGYSFDFSYTNTTFNYNGGSHEIMLRYNISKEESKGTPRYF